MRYSITGVIDGGKESQKLNQRLGKIFWTKLSDESSPEVKEKQRK